MIAFAGMMTPRKWKKFLIVAARDLVSDLADWHSMDGWRCNLCEFNPFPVIDEP